MLPTLNDATEYTPPPIAQIIKKIYYKKVSSTK